jgi:hypothetical protein
MLIVSLLLSLSGDGNKWSKEIYFTQEFIIEVLCSEKGEEAGFFPSPKTDLSIKLSKMAIKQ